MKLLEEKIQKDGIILPGDVLKVDSFINHQIDVNFISECGKEWYNLYKDCCVTKIVTIEASGIGIACITAQWFGVPVVFAKKAKSSNIGNDFYTTQVESYTHGKTYDVIISKKYISPDDKILIIDDFLATGSAIRALIDLVRQGGATVVGAGAVIEKTYQRGGDDIRAMGYRVESLARIRSMSPENGIEFC